MKIPVLDEKQLLEQLSSQKNPYFKDYYAFYSSWFGGITTNPSLMLLPIDDHMVHRGDGVFEAFKVVNRAIFLFDEHLDRLFLSAEMIKIKPSLSLEEMKSIIMETLKVANRNEATVRIFLSRGPGNFSVNPYDSVGPQFYVVITALKPPAAEKYQNGVAIGRSTIPIKDSWMATVKSCNYLPNVMMKKEAVDRGMAFVIGISKDDIIAEGPTENIIIINSAGTIVHPEFDNILKGTTLLRVCELAKEEGIATEARAISVKDLLSAKEVMMCGTTLDVLPVVTFENEKIGDGKPGPLAEKLRKIILNDINTGPKRTLF